MPEQINVTQDEVITWATVAAQFAAILLAIGLLSVLVASKKPLFLPTVTVLFAAAFILFGRMVAFEIEHDTLVVVLIPVVILSCWGRDYFKDRG